MDQAQQSQPARRRSFSLLGLLEVSCVMLLGATLVGFLARAWWLLELATHFRVHLGVLLLGAALFWAWRRRWRWVAASAGGCLLNAAVVLPFWLWGGVPPAAGAGALRIVSLNVHTANTRSDLVLQFLREADPDVVLLMEVNNRWANELEAWSARYPHRLVVAREDNFGIALFSRVPWTNASVIELGSAEVPTVAVDLELGGRRVHLVGTHPLPPGTAAYAALRNEQLRQLASHVRGQAAPVIVAGDLNTTPWSPFFGDLLRDSGLAATSRGRGGFGSWPGWLPVGRIHIDHCLVSPGFAVAKLQHGPDVGSDHLPLRIELHLPEVRD